MTFSQVEEQDRRFKRRDTDRLRIDNEESPQYMIQSHEMRGHTRFITPTHACRGSLLDRSVTARGPASSRVGAAGSVDDALRVRAPVSRGTSAPRNMSVLASGDLLIVSASRFLAVRGALRRLDRWNQLRIPFALPFDR
jgi:hypothetical protein